MHPCSYPLAYATSFISTAYADVTIIRLALFEVGLCSIRCQIYGNHCIDTMLLTIKTVYKACSDVICAGAGEE